ncbi:prestalk protein-like [Littorina saxatilis]|uniref:EGF-like domain-containing protein n=1 Tax=Littorina saxatilis TaxID=31220 RepID=A0AAN9BU88_9CAEN
MDVRHCAAVLSVLGVFAVLCVSDGQQDCESGSACFRGGRGVPDDVSVNDLAYYCCPEKNTTRNSTRTNGTVDFCTCRPDFTLDEKIQKWADGSKNLGRMCSRGETACSGSKSNSTTNFRFKTCCWPQQGFTSSYKHTTTIIFDGDKEEYIGCRCNTSIPSPDPRAYIVPQTAMYNSTGEVCSYDKGCDHKPSLKCTSPEATFCCYGSRGIVTENDGDSLTRCTCTNQVFGEMCESAPVPIPQTPLDGQQDCESGSACFRGGRGVPDDVSVNDLAYYCCPEKNTTRNSTRTNGTVDFCTCRPDFTLDEKIQKWADGSKNLGRMCSRGETACSGSKSNSTTNFRFKTCCWPQQGFTTTIIFDGDKEEYIGCRCKTPIPSPDPRAYIVPQTAMYNSTGEVCSYDKGCDHKPSLKCTSPEATFCCYGSRGIVTENDGDSLTRCTCTNQVFGEMCESAPVPIPQTPLDGQQDCESGSACFRGGRGVPDDVSVNDLAYYCCPEKNTTRNSTRTNGTVDFCTCRPDFTLDEKIQKWADGSKNLGRMCSRGETACSGSKSNSTTNFRFKTCCWPQQGFTSSYKHTTTIIFDGDKEEYIGCRCNTSIPSPDPRAYIVPQTAMYNSTGEVCSYDKGCDHKPSLKCTSPEATFCCYGSRGIVTENDGDSLTRCTCTNQVFGEMCESAPVPIPQTQLACLSDCSGKDDDDDVCKDDQGNERCCAHNMAVKVTLHNGNISDCTCTTAKDKSCVTSSAPTFLLQSAAQLLVLVLSAALLGQRNLIH